MTSVKFLLYSSSFILSFTSNTYAQNSIGIDSEFQACMTINDASSRFTCYETLAKEVRQARPENQHNMHSAFTNTASTPALIDNTNKEINTFGNPIEETITPIANQADQSIENYESNEPRIAISENGIKELQDHISNIKYMRGQILEITLAGGQVWRQTVPKRYNLKEGARVKIYPSGWGSAFRLEMEGRGGYIQVRRVQ